MDNFDETAELSKRQTEIEAAMKRPGGARVIEEQELYTVRRKLGTLGLSPRVAGASLAVSKVEGAASGETPKQS